MDAFAIMATQLVRDVLPLRQAELPTGDGTKVDSIRVLLRVHGPMRSNDIAYQLGLPNVSVVSALLKHDLACGRVERRSGGDYALSPEWEEDEHQRVLEAKALLRRYGFKVTGRAA